MPHDFPLLSTGLLRQADGGCVATRSTVWAVLTILQARVLGCLLEKERTVPDQYPLSLNAVVLACNQSTNREPVMSVADHEVELALGELKASGYVRMVHPTHGRGVTKYRQVVDEKLALEGGEAGLLAMLLLRGPQTAGELRSRAERLHAFTSVDDAERTLRSMSERPEPLAELMEREPGRREPRWRQVIADEVLVEAPAAAVVSSRPGVAEMVTRIDELEARVATLEAALADLMS